VVERRPGTKRSRRVLPTLRTYVRRLGRSLGVIPRKAHLTDGIVPNGSIPVRSAQEEMANLTLKEVRQRCADGRYFPYDGWRDRLFTPAIPWVVWAFVRLGLTGNAVSLLSGAAAITGSCMMASRNPATVVVGSFGYMLFYFLDYADGGVARIRGQSGIGGQYVDWTMHTVSAVGVAAGLLAGAVTIVGPWIIPFGVATVVAAALSLDRYALGWFAICMHRQQQQVLGKLGEPNTITIQSEKSRPLLRVARSISTRVFHENYAIFLLPALAIFQFLVAPQLFDFRVAVLVIGGTVYFPVVVFDIWRIAKEGRVDDAYRRLFWTDGPPRLPEDHYF
jgi:phosphatidylglycerophosphate synthase